MSAYRPPNRRGAAPVAASHDTQNVHDAERERNRLKKLAALHGPPQEASPDEWDEPEPAPAPVALTTRAVTPPTRADKAPATAAPGGIAAARPAARAAELNEDAREVCAAASAAAGPALGAAPAEERVGGRRAALEARATRATYVPPGRKAAHDRVAKEAQAAKAARQEAEAARQEAEAARQAARHAAIEDARREGAERRARAAAEEAAATEARRRAAAERRAAMQAEADGAACAAEATAAEAEEARLAGLELARQEGAERRTLRREAEAGKRAVALDRVRESVERGRTDAQEAERAERKRQREEERREEAAFPRLAPQAAGRMEEDGEDGGAGAPGTAEAEAGVGAMSMEEEEEEENTTEKAAAVVVTATEPEPATAMCEEVPEVDEAAAEALPALSQKPKQVGLSQWAKKEAAPQPSGNAWAIRQSAVSGTGPNAGGASGEEASKWGGGASSVSGARVVANRLITGSLSLSKEDARAAREVAKEKQVLADDESKRKRDESERAERMRKPW